MDSLKKGAASSGLKAAQLASWTTDQRNHAMPGSKSFEERAAGAKSAAAPA